MDRHDMMAFYSCPRCNEEQDVTDQVRHATTLNGQVTVKGHITHRCKTCGGHSSVVFERVDQRPEEGEVWAPVLLTYAHE